MKRILLISAMLLPSLTGIKGMINPFKPYKPLNEIDYTLNWEKGKEPTSIAYRPETLTTRSLLPMGMLATSILYNDYALEMRIKKMQGRPVSPPMHAADVLQYSPAAVLYIMKTAGLESRSDWPRMITADLLSAAMTIPITRITKNTIQRQRPDGSTRDSYPSGHTATAFMCAHMLHKEYGETVSPWISVGGYGMASAAGICRIISNRHFCSDVMCGAAIGIFATELSYDLTDLLFGEHGLRKPIVVPDMYETPEWRFGLQSSYSMGSDVFTGGGYGNPDARPACSIGIHGTRLFGHIGPTLYAGLTQMKWTGTDDLYIPVKGSVADVYTVAAGLDAEMPVLERISLNGQVLAGYSPKSNSYSFVYRNQPLEWDIPAGMHCYANLGMTVRTSSFSSVTVHGGMDYYDKVWRSLALGANFNFTF